jgi:predicted nuclease with TOPRIM domain
LGSQRDRIERLDAELRQVAEKAGALVRAAQDLRASLDSLADELREAARAGPPAAAEPRAAEPDRLEDNGDVPEGARLVALDMVLAGAAREDVAARLRQEFDLADPGPLLDDVFARVGG